MNFTWFASAYDNDDGPFRLATLVQITGALILAAGVARAFADQNFDTIFLGYAVMRAGLVALWLRAARHDPARRKTALRYAASLTAVMFGWSVMYISGYWPLWGFWLMAAIELAIPLWAEHAEKTPWHPDHMAERYGLLTIIVLGESILAATVAVQVALDEQSAMGDLYALIGGGLLIVFSLWWLYFAKPAHRFLTSNKESFVWGYGHYFIFAAVAAMGAGLAVNVDYLTNHAAISQAAAGATVTIPVAVFLVMLWALHLRPHEEVGLAYAVSFLACTAVILVVTFSASPVLLTGLVTAALASIITFLTAREHERSTHRE